MTKRLVEIDDEVLEAARQALGTSTIKETVEIALNASIIASKRRCVTTEDLLRVGELLQDLREPEVRARAWR